MKEKLDIEDVFKKFAREFEALFPQYQYTFMASNGNVCHHNTKGNVLITLGALEIVKQNVWKTVEKKVGMLRVNN